MVRTSLLVVFLYTVILQLWLKDNLLRFLDKYCLKHTSARDSVFDRVVDCRKYACYCYFKVILTHSFNTHSHSNLKIYGGLSFQ